MTFISTKTFKSISLILVFFMLFNIAGLSYAETVTTTKVSPATPAIPTHAKERIQAKIGELPNKPPSQRMELTSKRNKYSTRFINPDGSFSEEIYLEPTFYQDATSKDWKKIDNQLNASARRAGKLENKSNDFSALFSNVSGTKELLTVEKDGKTIDFIPVDAAKVNGKATKNEVIYPEIYPNVDFRYVVQGSKVKEDIILHQYTGKNIFSFELKLKGYTVVQEDDGMIYVLNNKGEKEWYFEDPFMLDANEKYSDDVQFVLRQEEGKTFVDVVAGVDFLENTDTKYPVIIDPTINTWNTIADTFVSSWNPNSSFSSASNFYTGHDSGAYGTMRSLIKFYLPNLPSDANITSANFNAYQNRVDANNTTIELFRITSDWSGSVTWNTQPTIKSISDSAVTSNASEQYWQWHITQLVRDWYNGAQPNYGMMLKQGNEGTTPFRRFTSINSGVSTPRLTINYTVEPIGLESFWGYSKDGVNPASGNLVHQQNDLDIAGLGDPVVLTRTYNSRKTDVSGIFGNGWISNYEAHILDAGKGPITLVDGDSTRHIFSQEIDGSYKAPGGVYMTLEKNADGTYTIYQMDGTVVSFNTSGKITSILDTSNHRTTLAYTNGKISTITDASGRFTKIYYNANGLVSIIEDPAKRIIQYQYDTAGNLIKVIDPEYKAITMGYGSDKSLRTYTDQRGNTTTISYDTSNRVTSISSPITIEGVLTNSVTSYSYNTTANTTTVTDALGGRVDYQYNPNKNIIQLTENPLDSVNKRVSTYAFDNANNLVEQREIPANTVDTTSIYTYQYDTEGNLEVVQSPTGQVTDFKYDANNNLINKNDPQGNDTSYQYDSKNNEVAAVDAAIQSTASKYNIYGKPLYQFKNISAADNLAKNSSLELDANGDGWADHWDKLTQTGTTATYSWSNDAKFGKKSISISNPTGWAVATSQKIPYDSTKKPNFVFSGYIKTTNTTGNATIKVDYYNSTGAWLGQTISNRVKGTHDWTRVQAATGVAPDGTDHFKVTVSLDAGSGTAYFDGIQVELGNIVSSYNLMENGGFEDVTTGNKIPDHWTTSGNFSTSDTFYDKIDSTTTGVEDENVIVGKRSFKITGEAGKDKFIKQRINISGDQNTKLTLSGWSKQEGANPTGGNYEIKVGINYVDETTGWKNANSFDKNTSGWQHVAVKVTPEKAFSSIDVFYYYFNQTGEAYFDGTRLETGITLTNYTYDSLQNYTTSVTDPLGNTVSFGYDGLGNRTSITDAKGKQTFFTYDKRSLLTQVTDTKGAITFYGYDAAGNKTSITDARNKITRYEHNEFNLISKIINPLNQATTLEYDKTGNRTKLIYPKGDTISNSYDVDSRLSKIIYNGVERFGYSYDSKGNVTKITDLATNKDLTYTYDENHRITKQQIGANNSMQYNYDANGNLTSLVSTNGTASLITGYNYNQLDQIIQLTRNGSNLARFLYNEEGSLVNNMRQNKTSTIMQYDDSNKLNTVTNYNAQGGVLNRFFYTYDANGNRTSVETDKGTINYQYDALNILTQETLIDGSVISYEHDAVGNRTKKITTFGGTTNTINYTYNDGNELISVNGQAYNYDVNGNLISNGSKSFVYEIDNRLKEVRNNLGQTIASYTYDYEGKRTSMTTSGGTTHFYYNGDKVVYETDANNSIVAEYTYDPQGNPATMTRGGVTYYYHINGHGDVVSLTDGSGNVVASYDYDAYGNIISQSGTMASVNPYRYAGYRYDEGTGLYYLISRYYDANIGRFITRDKVHGVETDPLSLNQYNYAHSNPVMYIDPSGTAVAHLAGAALGAGVSIVTEIVSQALAYFINNKKLTGFRLNKGAVAWAGAKGALTGVFGVTRLKKSLQAVWGGVVAVIDTAYNAYKTKRKPNIESMVYDFIVGFVGGYLSGNGIASGYFRKNIFSKGGHYVVGGVVHKSLPVLNRTMLREFAKSAAKSVKYSIEVALFEYFGKPKTVY